MRKYTQTILCFLAAMGLMAFGGYIFRAEIAEAAGHIGIRNVVSELRTRVVTFPLATPSSSEVTMGTNGVIAVPTVTSLTGGALSTTTIDMLPYPCKVDVVLIDSVTNDTLVCTSVTLYGNNQFGTPISETISSISETAVESQRVYESISRVVGTGCTGSTATETGDVLRVSASNEVGLGFRIDSEAAGIQVCLYDVSATDTLCAQAADFVGDLDDDSIEFDGATGLPTIAQGDFAIIRIRAPAGL